jgi:hypothetical protein
MTVPPEYQHIFALFSKVKECRNYWKICCPGHNDVHPSATVRIGREGLLFKCFSQHCTFRQIMAGLATRAGRPLCCKPWNGERDGGQKPTRRIKPMAITKVYPYQDEGGEILYEKCRIEPGAGGRKKDFMSRRPNPEYDSRRKLGEEWIWNLEGCRRVLYGLPDLVEALKGQEALPQEKRRMVVLTEGEKDCETAWDMGFVATTGDGGARNLHMTETDALAGSNVVIPFDRDLPDDRTKTVPGLEHALQAVNILSAKGCRVQLLRLPGGPGDFTDWVGTFPAEGRPDAVRAEIRRLLRASPAWTPWGPEPIEAPARCGRSTG